jgi:crossover junction endodeoxyribonuclease RuvC
MIILGIDPGIATVGVGVVRYDGNRFTTLEYGSILTPAKTALESRLGTIYSEICAIIEKYKPDAAAVEELFFNTNVKTAIAVGHGRGVILLACGNCNVPVFEYTPLQIKQAVTGYGRADKNQVQQMTKMLLSLAAVPKPDDTADALAVAICHCHSAGAKMYR